MDTRQCNPEEFPLGTIITEADKSITSCRLPTYGQVMRCFLAHREGYHNWKWDAAKKAVQNIKEHYIKGGVRKACGDEDS